MSEQIYNKLMVQLHNPYGVCGAMGNIYCESGFKSNNLQNSGNKSLGMTDDEYTIAVDNNLYTNFSKDAIGYGLCQWTSSGRKASLFSYAKATNRSISDLDMQIEFLIKELKTSYKTVYSTLLNAKTVTEASDIFAKKFERPRNQSQEALANRAAYGFDFYHKYSSIGKVESMRQPTNFKQYDSLWSDIYYAVDGETSTIKSAGCGPTAMAGALNTIVSDYIDPVTAASWARMHGCKVRGAGTTYNFFPGIGKAYGVNVTQITSGSIYHNPNNTIHTTAIKELLDGNWLIALMGKGTWTTGGHYVLVYGYENGYVYINDPASSKAIRAKNSWTTFSNEVKHYWVIDVPKVIVKTNEYSKNDFVREVQMCINAGCDENVGPITIAKTPTVSKSKNRKISVVRVLQKRLKFLNLYSGALDRVAGTQFDTAAKSFQSSIVKLKKPDGEFTAKGTSWKTILKY